MAARFAPSDWSTEIDALEILDKNRELDIELCPERGCVKGQVRSMMPVCGHESRVPGPRRSRVPRRSHPIHKPAKSWLTPEWHGHLHRFFFIRLESDFLGQHYVASGEAACGCEAPTAEWRLQLEDVLLSSFLDEVPLAGFRADDFEAPISRVLAELFGREPFTEQDPRFGFGIETSGRMRSADDAKGDTGVTVTGPRLSGVGFHLPTSNQAV
jgi:hypothetical protein